MFNDSKYSKFLTALLIVVIIAIIGLLGFLGFDIYQKYFIEKDAKDFLENYEAEIGTTIKNLTEENKTPETTEVAENPIGEMNFVENTTTNSSSSTTTKKPQYKGFDVSGRIEIPAIDLDYPILSQAGKKQIEVAVGVQYGPGPNQPGNTIIAGHNYRNGLFFSNNKKLEIGDAIYITDNSGTKIKYKIYHKYETTPEDTDYWLRDTGGAREVSLTTCTDDSKARLIIWAKAE